MSEFSKFQDNINAKLEYQRQTELGINPEQLQLAERLDNFFSGLHAELLQQDVPFYQDKSIAEDNRPLEVVKKRSLFRRAVYATQELAEQDNPAKSEYWRLYYQPGSPDRHGCSGIPTEELIMKKSGALVYYRDYFMTDDKYLIYQELSRAYYKGGNNFKFNGITGLCERQIIEMLNIK